MTAARHFSPGRFTTESGVDLPGARLSYRTHGALAPDGRNCVLLPSYYTGTHRSYEPWIGPGRMFDPAEWFVVTVDMFGNGLSTSPSNWTRAERFPLITVADNVRAQHALLESLGVRSIALAVGWSMGALQCYEWAVRHPEMVRALLPVCGAARCSDFNRVFLAGVAAALAADPAYPGGTPVAGLRAFGTVYAGWAYSRDFFDTRTYLELGYSSVEDLIEGWARDHEGMDARDLMAMLDTWRTADIGHGRPGGFEAALGSITAHTIVMPGTTDAYFTLADSAREAELVPGARLRPIESDLGHIAGRPGIRKAETDMIAAAAAELLALASDDR
ncbi:MAG TPA: alpha/beta fold hydrolase [Nocardia sp.]|uniref:alpha/beta fold hydrolase n=1 Tax=Nocardia TaxID=1817 RepID=UPI0024582402|nr:MULTISPECIES: alpha/beta fold hydrolase [Nocardia]HLS75438.1 alpha/beta fold hydrolase [Nocardia sp.]